MKKVSSQDLQLLSDLIDDLFRASSPDSARSLINIYDLAATCVGSQSWMEAASIEANS